MGAIGYVFGSRLQRALQIPIGIIDNARGGASMESLVPRHKFAEHPMAAEYLAWVEQRQDEFDWDAAMKPLLEKWEKEAVEQRDKGVPEDELPPRPTRRAVRSWNVPGRSPSEGSGRRPARPTGRGRGAGHRLDPYPGRCSQLPGVWADHDPQWGLL